MTLTAAQLRRILRTRLGTISIACLRSMPAWRRARSTRRCARFISWPRSATKAAACSTPRKSPAARHTRAAAARQHQPGDGRRFRAAA